MTDELLAFFARYRDAFNRLDGEAVAALYAEPSAIAQHGVVTHWPDRAAVAANMVALCAQYRGRGFVSAAFEPGLHLPLGEHDAVVTLQWRITGAPGAHDELFRTAYHLTRTPQGWRVLLCTAYEESRPQQDAPRSGASPAASASAVRIEATDDAADADWLRLRRALWPEGEADEHRDEMTGQTLEPARYAQFLARDAAGAAIGLAEASLRHDYVPGTDSSPVGFLEGLYVEPGSRRAGVARALVAAVGRWTLAQGCTELASDTPFDNTLSQRVHERLGFLESERIVCFCKPLQPWP